MSSSSLPFPLEPAADPIDAGSSSSSLEMNDENAVVSTHDSFLRHILTNKDHLVT